MGRAPCCPKDRLNKGAWTALEDKILVDYITEHGEGKWRNIPRESGLRRCGKSCRLRWLNYLRPDIKRGNISPEEEDLIIRLHKLLGNRWSLIAGRLPGRTDNEIKNYWNTILKKKLKGQDKLKDGTGCNTKPPELPIKAPKVVASEPKLSMLKPGRLRASVPATRSSDQQIDGHHMDGYKVGLEQSVNDETKSAGGSPVTSRSDKENELDNLKMDFGISEFFDSDFSESELWKLCQFEGDDIEQQQPFPFPEELLKNWT